MQIDSLKIPDIKLFTNKVFKDDRGFFTERLRLDLLAEMGIENKCFVWPYSPLHSILLFV